MALAVKSVSDNQDGSYTFIFSEAVTVTGTPGQSIQSWNLFNPNDGWTQMASIRRGHRQRLSSSMATAMRVILCGNQLHPRDD